MLDAFPGENNSTESLLSKSNKVGDACEGSFSMQNILFIIVLCFAHMYSYIQTAGFQYGSNP